MATAAKTVYSHITKDPQVCGGRACIDRTRIRVIDVVGLQQQGYSTAKMLDVYPALNLAQIHAALSYSYQNPEEIAEAFEEDARIAEEVEGDRAKFLAKRSDR
jgi:uncharacterized protein (DUF433 family)